MDQEHDSGLPDSRAPWERPLADSAYRETQSGRIRRDGRPSDADRSDSARSRRAESGGKPEQLTVAELMDKVSRGRADPSVRGGKADPSLPRSRPSPPATGSAPPPPPPASRAGSGALPPARPPRPEPSPRPGGEPAAGIGDDAPTEALAGVPVAAVDAATPDPAEDPAPQAEPRAVGAAGMSRLALGKRRRRRKLRLAARSAVAVVSTLAFVATGGAWTYVRSTEAGFSQIAALDTESDDIVDPVGQTGDETFLIVGTDTRAGASGEVGAGTVEDAEGARADVVILVNIPADRSRVVAVSFPRDLDVERPVCLGWDSTTGDYDSEIYPAADGDKLNATYALGGPKCLVKVIQKMSGLKIGHFVGIDFAGFESMVDEVGGVEVCSPTPLVDGELGTIIEIPGTQVLDGRRALDYVRARKVASEGNGDYGRIARQQKFLSSLLRSALSNKVLFDPGKLNGFINAFTQATFVENVNTESLVNLGRSLQDVDAGAVTFMTIPTAGTNEWGNEIPRPDDIDAIFTAIIDDLPLPGEKREEPAPDAPADTADGTDPAADAAGPSTSPDSLVAVDPWSVSVQVSNASGVSGLAANTAENVAAYGFSIGDIGNYSGTSTQSVVRFSPGLEAQAATVASMFPGIVLQRLPDSAHRGDTVELVLGEDFDGTVAYPASAGVALGPVTIEEATDAESVQLPADLAITNAGADLCS